jgi:catechol 2,3-dioxygenase-like lactoylglutathione lyase family enzyme
MVSKEYSIAVMVSNAKKTSKWFVDTLGFESSAEDHWVLVWPKGSSTKIHLCEGTPDPGNTGIAFYVKNVGGLADELKGRGVKFLQDVKKESWGTNALVSDPDGNGYWLIEGTGP